MHRTSGNLVTGALLLKSDMTLFWSEGKPPAGKRMPGGFPLKKYRFEGLETMCYANSDQYEGDKRTERLHNIRIMGKGCGCQRKHTCAGRSHGRERREASGAGLPAECVDGVCI